jgi:hypothetical protein
LVHGSSLELKSKAALEGNFGRLLPILPDSESSAGEQQAAFQANVVSLHPAAVHIMLGMADAVAMHDSTTVGAVAGFLSAINAMVQEAKAANIKVILGIEPYMGYGYMTQYNAVLADYGAMNNIPVINYGDALCGCVGSLGGSPMNPAYFETAPTGTFPPNYPGETEDVLTPAGYAVMTTLAESVINTMNLRLEAGWLSNYIQDQCCWFGSGTNVNTGVDPDVYQFTPIGYYSDGSQHPMLNTNFQGASGTWTSSNPEVMYVNQSGQALALSPGTTSIKYTSPNGVAFAPWVMNVNE